MVLTDRHGRELTAEDRLFVFKRATTGFCGCDERWAERATKPTTNAELADALEYEIGIEGGSGGPGDPWVHKKGNGLKIWGGWEYPNPSVTKPLWSGAATIAMARHVYGIKTPEEFREPTLFDFAQEQQQNARA